MALGRATVGYNVRSQGGIVHSRRRLLSQPRRSGGVSAGWLVYRDAQDCVYIQVQLADSEAC